MLNPTGSPNQNLLDSQSVASLSRHMGYEWLLKEAAKREAEYIQKIKKAFEDGDKDSLVFAVAKWLVFLEEHQWYKTYPKILYNELRERGELNVVTE